MSNLKLPGESEHSKNWSPGCWLLLPSSQGAQQSKDGSEVQGALSQRPVVRQEEWETGAMGLSCCPVCLSAPQCWAQHLGI